MLEYTVSWQGAFRNVANYSLLPIDKKTIVSCVLLVHYTTQSRVKARLH